MALVENITVKVTSPDVSYLNTNVQEQLIGVSTVADLRNFEPVVDGQSVQVHEAYTGTGKASGGLFVYDSSDTSSTDNTGTVAVTASGKRWKRQYSGAVDVRWFGLIGDGTFDNASRLQAAITWSVTGNRKVTFSFPEGTFYVGSDITTSGRYGFNIQGVGGLRDTAASILKFATNKSLVIRGSGVDGVQGPTYMQMYISDMVLSGTSQDTDSPVKLVDTVGIVFDRCTFTMCLYGVNMLNEFYWSESNVIRNSYFSKNCTTALLYRVATGNQYISFYGSGLEDCFLENSFNGRPKIEIAARAQPYNAPMRCTMGHTPTSAYGIIRHNGDNRSWFIGNIKAEVGEEVTVELVQGTPLYIVGDFTCMGGTVQTTNAYFCYDVRQNVTQGLISYRRKPFSARKVFTAAGGGLAWSYAVDSQSPRTYKIYMTVAASSYCYEYELTMHTQYLNGATGSVTVDKTFRSHDGSGIGAPSIEYNSSNGTAQLYVWRSGLPVGAVVHMDIVPVSSGVDRPLL